MKIEMNDYEVIRGNNDFTQAAKFILIYLGFAAVFTLLRYLPEAL